MPMPFSMYHGGIVPCLLRMDVRRLIAAANGRTSSYVSSDIGASELGRWQFWQLRWRIGAMSFVNVTPDVEGAWPVRFAGVRNATAAADPAIASHAIRRIPGRRFCRAVMRRDLALPILSA